MPRTKCDECASPPVCGTRCIYHYIKRFAKRPHKISAWKKEGAKRIHRRKGYVAYYLYRQPWYRAGERRFAELLGARYLVISLGDSVPDRTPLFKAFHRHKRHRAALMLAHTIDAVDDLARRQYNDSVQLRQTSERATEG